MLGSGSGCFILLSHTGHIPEPNTTSALQLPHTAILVAALMGLGREGSWWPHPVQYMSSGRVMVAEQ